MLNFRQHPRTPRARRLSLAIGLYFGTIACEPPPDDTDMSEEQEGNILLADANNYTYVSSLDIPGIETASGVDIDVCWTGSVTDIQCHALDPLNDVDNMALIRFARLSEDEVKARLATVGFSQAESDGYLDYHTNNVSTCAKMSQLTLLGTEVDITEEYVASGERTYLLSLNTGIDPGIGTRTMTFLRPSTTSTNTVVELGEGCGLLEFTADLSQLAPIQVPAAGPWVADWRQVTRNGQGNELAGSTIEIDGVMLGFYANMTPADLQEQILDLELIATQLYRLDVGEGVTADLAKATAADGTPFGGFSGMGTWVLALTCGSCQNPAPVVLTTVTPVEGR